MYNLAQFRTDVPRVADLLLWGAMVDGPTPGIMLNKDGAYMATLKYRGADVAVMEPEERLSYLWRLNEVLKRLGTGWGLLADERHEPNTSYPASIWSNPAACFLDGLRRAFHQSGHLFESQQFLTITWKPPSNMKRTLFEQWFLKHGEVVATDTENRRAFRHALLQFGDSLHGIFPWTAWCTADEKVTYLKDTISWDRFPIQLPEVPMYLDCQLPTVDFLPGTTPELGIPGEGGYYLRPISVKTWPHRLGQYVPQALQNLPFPYRFTIRWRALDKQDAYDLMMEIMRGWRQLIWDGFMKGLIRKLLPPDAEAQAESAERAAIDVLEADIRQGHLTPLILVWAETLEELAYREREVLKCLQQHYLLGMGERANASHAWLGSLPGDMYHGIRAEPMPQPALGFLMPHATVWAGPERDDHLKDHALFVASSDGVPFRMSLHRGEVGHGIIVGPTRAGKSGLLAFMAMQFLRYQRAQVFAFDKDYSLLCATAMVGGAHYNLGGSGSKGLHILGRLDQGDEEMRWAQNWIETLLTTQGLELSPIDKSEIWAALERVSRQHPRLRTLSTFRECLQMQRLKPGLEQYCHGGPYSFFDAHEDSFELSWWTVLEMGDIIKSPSLPHAISYVFHRIDETLDGRPTLIEMDEAAPILSHPVFKPHVSDMLTGKAKKNVAFWPVWQQIAAGVNSDLWQDIQGSCQSEIYLPNAKALTKEVLPYYRDTCGLTSSHTHALAMAQTHRDYLYKSPEGTRLFQLQFSGVERALCAASSVEEVARLRQLMREGTTEPLVAAWLREQGYSDEADIFLQDFLHAERIHQTDEEEEWPGKMAMATE